MKLDKEDFNQILVYIEKNISSVTEEEISLEYKINRCYLSVLFKKFMGGVTYSQYNRQKKMEKARELLSKTEKPIKEIISESGYRSKSAFYRNAIQTELGNIKFEATYDTLPVEGKPQHYPAQYGINYIQFIPKSSIKGMKFRLEGHKGVDWSVSLVMFKKDGADIVSQDGTDGKLEMTVADVTRYEEIIIVVRNLGPEDYTGYYYYWLEEYEEEGCGCSAGETNGGNPTGGFIILCLIVMLLKVYKIRSFSR